MCDIAEKDLYWLAGLLEGEASFHLVKERGVRQIYPVIALKMCDRDVVERAAALLGRTREVVEIAPANPKHKRQYKIVVQGSRAIPWLHRLRPLMGARRQEQINAVLAGMTAINLNHKHCKKLDMDKARQIRTLWAERTMTQIEIAALFGVSKWTVFDVINGYRWAGDEPVEHRKYRCKLDDEQAQEIKCLREDRGMTLADIAELYGVHKSTIGRLLARS